MKNPDSDLEPTIEVVATAYKSNFWKFFLSFLFIIITVVGAYLVRALPSDNGGVGEEAAITDNSFFSSVGSNTKEALTRVFSGGDSEELVEVVNVKTGERAVGDVSQEAGAFGPREGEGVTMEEVGLQDDGEEARRSNPPPPEVSEPAGPIDINTSGYDELQRITGVGPTIAGRIIDYRDTNGPFYTIEEIQNVSGIGQATFEKMKNEITVGDIEAPPPEESEPALPPPEDGEEEALPPPEPEPDTLGKININTASYEELQGITGVKTVIAQRIIDYRNANGPFDKIEDIKNVKGIGPVTFEKMKDQITVGS